ncbi:MAG TPA: phosphoribosyltransferase [Anaeromyxobacteraceae bacterium]|jgi:hypothetical protein|nr:phosphoribosyltransferase [Anaeromyxobacteraceae bacterium]
MVTRNAKTKPARDRGAPRKAQPAAKPARKASAPARKASAPARKVTALRSPAKPARRRAAERAAGRPEQPLGVGVGDAFAVERLGAAPRSSRARKGVREISWEAFGDLARKLAARIGDAFRPELVVGIAKGGVVVGGAVAAALDIDFYPVRIEARGRDASPSPHLPPASDHLPDVTGKRVLVVDDVCQSGRTLERARALLRRGGPAAVRTATLISRPRGGRPDFSSLQTTDVAVFPWDYQLHTPDLGGGGDPGEAGV